MRKYILNFCLLCVIGMNQLHAQVLHVPFDGNSENYAIPNTENAVVSTTLTTDRFGHDDKAYSFNGTSSYVQFDNNSFYDLRAGFTISAWINHQGDGLTRWQYIVSKGFGNYNFHVYKNDDDQFVLRGWFDDNSFEGTVVLPSGWTHVAATVEGGSGGLKYYINGQLTDSFDISTDLVPDDTSYDLRVGNDPQTGNHFFNGHIDEVSIYRTLFDAEEILKLYEGNDLSTSVGNPDFGNALNFDGTNDFVLLDASDLNNHFNQGSFTFECWQKSSGSASQNNLLYFSSAPSYRQNNWSLEKMNYFYSLFPDTKKNILSNTTFDDEWHHVALVVDTEAQQSFYYVDGRNQTVPEELNLGFWGQNDEFMMGRQKVSEVFTNYFTGTIDEFRIWNVARSTPEIISGMSIPISPDEEGLVYYFDFDHGSAGSENTNELTLENRVNPASSGTLYNFSLSGSSSNWVTSSVGKNNSDAPVLLFTDKNEVLAGADLTITTNTDQWIDGSFQIYLGETAVQHSFINGASITVMVSEDIYGYQTVTMIDKYGISNKLDINVMNADATLTISWNQHAILTNASGVIEAADLNSDGIVDLVVAGADGLHILTLNAEGEKTSTYSAAVRTYTDVVLLDADADGDKDIIAATNGGDLYMYENNGSSWSETALGLSGYASDFITAGDLDSDGDLDLVAYAVDVKEVDIFRNNSNGSFTYITTKSVPNIYNHFAEQALDIADLNNDGLMDIALASKQWYVLENVGGLDFTVDEIAIADVATEGIRSIQIEDINNDGYLDLIAAENMNTAMYYAISNGDMTFSSVRYFHTNRLNTRSLHFADINADGYTEFFSGHNVRNNLNKGRLLYRERNTVGGELLNGFQYNFVDGLTGDITDIETIDLNNDGDLDLVVNSGMTNSIEVFFNQRTENRFTAYSVDEQVIDPIYSLADHTITVVVPHGTLISKLIPRFEISNKASITLKDGSAVESGNTVTDFVGTDNSVIYTITAENGDQQDWTVTAKFLPPKPEITDVADITSTTATLQWEEISDIEAYEIYTTQGKFINTTIYDSINVAPGTIELLLEGLEPSTQYSVFIKAANTSGDSQRSDIVSFLTAPDAPQTISIEDITQDQAIIRWETVEGAEAFLLEVSADQFIINERGYSPKTVTALSDNIDQLTPGEFYEVRIRAQNSTGPGTYSDIVYFYTIPQTPVSRAATSSSSTAFTAHWDLVSGDSISYEIDLSENENFDPIIKTEDVGNVGATLFSNLQDGRSYWYRVRAKNPSGLSPNSTVIMHEKPLTISNLAFPENLDLSGSDAANISFDVAGGDNDWIVTLRYRGATATVWQTQDLTVSDDGFSHVLQRSAFDELGLDFQIVVNDDGVELLSDIQEITWTNIGEDIPLSTIGGQWHLFSIPFVLQDNTITNVFDELGNTKYKVDWRLMHYNGERYVDVDAGISTIDLGKGYWFNSLKTIEVTFDNAVINTADPFEIELREGWNQIGNPYNVPISWETVRNDNAANSFVSEIMVYNPVTKLFSEGNVIQPYEGGFVWSDQATTVAISSTSNKSASRDREEQIEDLDGQSWSLDLSLEFNGSSISIATFGMHKKAASGKDGLDRRPVPRFFDYIDMFTKATANSALSRDIRPTQNQDSWLYHLESNILSGQQTISWDQQMIANSNAQVWLIDESNGTQINMGEESSYGFAFNGNHQFSLHYSTDPSSTIAGYNLQIGDPYPNPASNVTNLGISLPRGQEQYDVEVVIHDFAGRIVGRRETESLAPGYHEIQTDLSKLNLKDGIYYYTIHVANSNIPAITKKFIFRK